MAVLAVLGGSAVLTAVFVVATAVLVEALTVCVAVLVEALAVRVVQVFVAVVAVARDGDIAAQDADAGATR